MGQREMAMISAYDYYTKIAKPTVDDFLAHNDNVRQRFWRVWRPYMSSTTSHKIESPMMSMLAAS
jgi:hypothetical protein